jgi:hypothetical protein
MYLSPAYDRETCVISFGFYNFCLYEDDGTECPTSNPVDGEISEAFYEDLPWFTERARYASLFLSFILHSFIHFVFLDICIECC